MAITDHGLVELHIDLRANKSKAGRWRLNTSLLQDEQFATRLGEDIKVFLDIKKEKLQNDWLLFGMHSRRLSGGNVELIVRGRKRTIRKGNR